MDYTITSATVAGHEIKFRSGWVSYYPESGRWTAHLCNLHPSSGALLFQLMGVSNGTAQDAVFKTDEGHTLRGVIVMESLDGDYTDAVFAGIGTLHGIDK